MEAKVKAKRKVVAEPAADIETKRKAASAAARSKAYRERKKAASQVEKLHVELPKPLYGFFVELCTAGKVTHEEMIIVLLTKMVESSAKIRKLAERHGLQF
jgi:hypothetical protein